MFKGFEPCFDENSKVLILGSFPSVKSREYGFYYGNKQNRFWKMLETVFNEKIDDDVESKKSFLHKHHIALFDVVLESNLHGSADVDLVQSKHKISDLSPILPPNTQVQKILCNGKTAYNILMENFKTSIPIIYLPSTSPANPRYNVETWRDELNFITSNKL